MLPISLYIWFFPVLPKADGGGGHQGTGLLSSCSAPPAGKTGRSEDLWPITSTRLVPSSTLGAWPAPMCCIPAPVCGEHTPLACSTAAVISVVEAPLQCMEACLLGCQILTTSQQNHKAQLNLNRFFSLQSSFWVLWQNQLALSWKEDVYPLKIEFCDEYKPSQVFIRWPNEATDLCQSVSSCWATAAAQHGRNAHPCSSVPAHIFGLQNPAASVAIATQKKLLSDVRWSAFDGL